MEMACLVQFFDADVIVSVACGGQGFRMDRNTLLTVCSEAIHSF